MTADVVSLQNLILRVWSCRAWPCRIRMADSNRVPSGV